MTSRGQCAAPIPDNQAAPPFNTAKLPWWTREFERATLFTFDTHDKVWRKKSVAVKINSQSFNHGSFRYCHKMDLRDPHNPEDEGESMVLKVFKEPKSAETYFSEAMVQILSNTYTSAFNECSKRAVNFLPVYVLKLHERNDSFATVEPFLSGKYVKHNDNDGHIDSCDAVPQAFSHFTWAASKRKLLIVDIQGCGDMYTDPSVQSVQDDQHAFGDGNCGWKAIAKFFVTHKCSAICRAHGLPTADKELEALKKRCQPCSDLRRLRRRSEIGRSCALPTRLPSTACNFPRAASST